MLGAISSSRCQTARAAAPKPGIALAMRGSRARPRPRGLDLCIQHTWTRNSVIEGGFPHSDIRGSKLVRSSPRLFAAYHVLHRLSAPRHPPNALKALDRSHYQCPPRTRRGSRTRELLSALTRTEHCIRKTSLPRSNRPIPLRSSKSRQSVARNTLSDHTKRPAAARRHASFRDRVSMLGTIFSSPCQISRSHQIP